MFELPALNGDVVAIAAALVDIPSVSGDEKPIADAVFRALQPYAHLDLRRDGDAVVAATNLGRPARLVIAGHLDTVPIANNVPGKITERAGEEVLWGRGSVDMKTGVAAQLYAAATVTNPKYDVTWIFYDHEEVDSDLNGLGRLARNHPDWLAGDGAILCEPTGAGIEGGCNGTLRAQLRFTGRAAHSARTWLGTNAIHQAGEALVRLRDYQPATVTVDGLDYRESLGAVWVDGGTAMNSVPDNCRLWINYRFAPSKTEEQALAHVQELFADLPAELVVEDNVAGARPGLTNALMTELVDLVAARGGGPARPKYGWTDVARFSALGIPAINFGPGEPPQCHTDDENCPTAQIRFCAETLVAYLS